MSRAGDIISLNELKSSDAQMNAMMNVDVALEQLRTAIKDAKHWEDWAENNWKLAGRFVDLKDDLCRLLKQMK